MRSTLGSTVRSLSLLVLLGPAPLIGCGSGSEVGADVQITAENGDAAAKAAVSALLGFRQTDDTPPAANAIFTLGLDRSNVWGWISDALRNVGQPPGMDPCNGAGAVLRSHADNDGNGVASAGDVYTSAYTACQDAPGGNVQDGSVALNLSSYGGAPGGPWNLAGLVQIFITLGTPSGPKTLSGDIDLTASLDPLGVLQVDMTVVYFNKQGPVHRLTWLSGQITYTLDTSTGAYTLVSNATIDSTRLGGVVTFATSPLGMTGQRGQFPSQGMMTVHGTGNSTLRIAAIDRFTAQVDIDADGDFVFETSEVRQWIHLVH